MQELVGRLTALDPEASESLKVVAYFDALVRAGASVDALLRAAAVLSGVIAGARLRGRVSRYAPDGTRIDGAAPETSKRLVHPDGNVWLERLGPAHANDDMILERLGLAVELAVGRHRVDASLEVAVDRDRPLADRHAALARLRLAPEATVRVIALPLDASEPGTVPIPTAGGLVRALLDDGDLPLPRTAGVGLHTRADHLPDSWHSAVIALRLRTPQHPVVDAQEWGALLLLADAYDPAEAPDDVRRLAALDARSRAVLEALVAAESVRAASAALAMHHSTLQARHDALVHELGYDPRSVLGRARYLAAEMLRRLAPPV